MRIAELEASLAQERQSSLAARRDVDESGTKLIALGNELAEAMARAEKSESELGDRERTLSEQAIALRDREISLENLERQLFGEAEQNKALISENKALRLEAQAADAALSRSEHELMTLRERLGVLDLDSRRLQILSEEQSAHLAELTGRHKDVEAAADADRQRLRVMEGQLGNETAARERAEAQLEVEVVSYRTERAALAMKLDASDNRAATAEQLLAQTRNALREKDEAHRLAERSLKEAGITRTTAERRVEALQVDLARQNERFLDAQRLRTELEARCSMLNKALAAKEAAMEQAGIRNNALADRIEELNRKYETSRSDLETACRRLAEDLENEKSERTLLQGALDIARETRIALQKQHDALKRSSRGWRAGAMADSEDNLGGEAVHESDNVRPFAPAGKSS